ncbi:hypothetical protein [Phormidesmis priestleyi]
MARSFGASQGESRQMDSSSKVVQLDLWSALDVAEDLQEEADLQELWASLEVALEPLSVRSQLTLAGDAIVRLAQLVQDRAWLTIEELHQLGNTEGPIMAAEAFDRFVRQSMQVNFEPFIEAPPVPPRIGSQVSHSTEFPDDGRSVVVEVDRALLLEALKPEVDFVEIETYEQAIALAHSENIQAWTSAISQCFASQPSQSIPFLELTRTIHATNNGEVKEPRSVSAQTWLALLLGDYQLEQRGEFYQAETLWVTRD